MNSVPEKKKKGGNTFAVLMLALVGVGFAAVIWADSNYMPKYKKEFLRIEKERVTTSNKLMTAKIVQENLNHVRELIFNNIDFPGQPDTIDHETQFFEFMTTCVNDLKLKLVSVRPVAPSVNGRVTTYAYDVDLEGDFFKFGELCAKLENNRRLVSIENFDVDLIDNSVQDRNNQTEFKGIKVKLRVNTYRIAGKA